MTPLITSNETINDIKVKSLEELDLLLKDLRKQQKMKQRNKQVDFVVCY